MNEKIKIRNRQSLFDVALQHCGHIEAAMDIAIRNNLSVSSEVSGIEIEIVPIVDAVVIKRYIAADVIPATSISNESTDGGIEFWGIEYDFVIS